jgi:hypothetical protein
MYACRGEDPDWSIHGPLRRWRKGPFSLSRDVEVAIGGDQ